MTAHTAPGTETIEALLRRFQSARDVHALATLFDRTAPSLFRVALSVAPDAATAEEAVQETFLALLEHPDRVDASQPLMPWLVSVLRNKVIDARRRVKRVPDPLTLEPRLVPDDPADVVERKETIDRVRAALDRLEEPYRSVALLRWEYGLEPGEIAHARGEPPGTVRSLLSRALQRLRRDLGGATAIVLVLGMRPPVGLTAVRKAVLAKAGSAASMTASGIAVGGVIVTKLSAALVLVGVFALGATTGIAALGGRADAASAAAGARGPAIASMESAKAPRVPSRETEPGVADTDEGPRPDALAAQGKPADEAADAERILARFSGDWISAWNVGVELSRLASPKSMLTVLSARWKSLTNRVHRQNLLKGFSYESSNPLRLEVFHLGATDPDPRVREWALGYLEPYAGRDLVEDAAAYPAWRASSAGIAPEVLLDGAADRLFAAVRTAEPGRRGELVSRLARVFDKRGPGAPSAEAALAAALGWLDDPQWGETSRVLDLIRATRPSEAHAREIVETRMRLGGESERRALLLAGRLDARWARDVVLERLRSPDPGIASAAVTALADFDDLRSIRDLVEALPLRRDEATSKAIVVALERMTNVTRWEGHDAVWWQHWWTENRVRFEEAAAKEEVR